MRPLTWVLLGILLFWVLAILARQRGLVPEAIRVQGPLVTVHTKRGRGVIEWIAAPKRFWRAWGNFGLGIALVVMVGSVLFLAAVAVATVLNPPPETAVNQPRNVLIIPGINDFLPLSVAPEIIAGLVIGVVIHEAGHGILCRVEDIDIKSMGLVFITVIFAGAFVEPDEESQRRASRGGRSRMFAAGVTNNFALTAVAFLLLFGPVVGSLSVVSGATVATAVPGSPAATAGVGQGDVITAVEGVEVTSNEELGNVLANLSTTEVEVRFRDGTTERIERSVLVTTTHGEEWPFAIQPSVDQPNRSTIVSVNGTAVQTTAGFRDAIADRSHVRIQTADGREHTGPVGAYVTVPNDGPLASAGAEPGGLIISSFAGERVVDHQELLGAIQRRDPGDTVSIVGYRSSGPVQHTVTLGEQSAGDAYLGVFVAGGVSGLSITDLGVEGYPAGRYLGVLGGDCPKCAAVDIGTGQRVLLALQLPLAGITGGQAFPYNFAGFTDGIQNFYTVGGPLGALGGWLFVIANLLFWTAWINLNLGFFNCIPTFLLDGGHMFRAAIEAVVARLPVSDGHRIVGAATLSIQFIMLGSLALMLFGAQLFG